MSDDDNEDRDSTSLAQEMNMFDNDKYDEESFDFDEFDTNDDYDGNDLFENRYKI
jgi:hypothetical protein